MPENGPAPMIQRDSSLKKPTTPLHRRNGRRDRRSRSGIRRDSAARTDYPQNTIDSLCPI